MNKINIEGSMLGYNCPFFLNNANLSNAYYQYVIYSPAVDEDLNPYVSMTKINEKTKSDPSGNDGDILAVILGSKKNLEEDGLNLVADLLKKEFATVTGNGKEFPWIEMKEGLGIQKTLITSLRSSLKWKNYRFIPGRFIDILWTPTEFVVFKICGNDNEFWFEPIGVYKTTDLELKNPLDIDLSKLNYPKEKFSKKTTKISDINRLIKKLEWNSFDRKNLW